MLHWLPVCFRMDFEILLLVYKALDGFAPTYLTDVFLAYEPSRTRRSSGSGLLIIPKVRTKTHGEESFYCFGPCLWNRDEDLRAAENVDIFFKQTQDLFSLAFN